MHAMRDTGRAQMAETPGERVTGIMGGALTPLPSEPLLSSAGTPWAGFLLERHIVHAAREEVGWSWHETHVGLCTAGASPIQVDGAAGEGRFLVEPGRISLFPRDCDCTTIRHSGGGLEFVVVQLDRRRLLHLLHDDAGEVDVRLAPQLYVPDPVVAALVGNMRAEVEAGCPSGALYAEALSLALACHLANRYPLKPGSRDQSQPRLSRAQTRTVLDYIDAHLGQDFSLVELGRLARVSPRRFARLFRNTFDASVHRFILKARIRRAKSLLAERRLPIVEISHVLGFASQSHFTDVFRRTEGVSPRRYRQGS